MAKLILDYCTDKSLIVDNELNDLLKIVKKHDEELIEKTIRESHDYPVLFNLKKERGNILIPCAVSKNDDCLEVGSECGAITVSLVNASKFLDCIELSKQKSEINYERNFDRNNLNIYVGDFSSVASELAKKYDKIFLLGALKQASMYMPNSESPFMDMLALAKSLLKPNGQLFIAIENKYGMKYFNGAREDDTGNVFESIEGYKASDVKTFSSVQLRKMLSESGFESVYFYYPLPDYKFANMIYSEDYLPMMDGVANVGHSMDYDRTIIFDEDKALMEASQAGVFEVFANSFLIKAGVKK